MFLYLHEIFEPEVESHLLNWTNIYKYSEEYYGARWGWQITNKQYFKGPLQAGLFMASLNFYCIIFSFC